MPLEYHEKAPPRLNETAAGPAVRKASSGPWGGTLLLGLTRALYVGPVRDTSLHAHHALQICIALDAPLLLRSSEDGKWREYGGAIIPSDTPHQIDGRGGRHALIYLEPETADGRRIAPAKAASIQSLRIEDSVRARLLAAAPQQVYAATTTSLKLGALELRVIDPRVAAAIQAMRAEPAPCASVKDLARSVGLSPRRFRELFARETATSCRRFLVWVRLYRAVRALSHGLTLTAAAYEAGFADSAHLSRSFRRVFGIAPSNVSREICFMEIPS